MDAIFFTVITYAFRFSTDPTFQAKQKWVDWVIGKLSVVHHHIWTAIRLFGWAIAIWVGVNYNSELGTLIYVIVSLTDWVDGKVKRYRDEHNIEGRVSKAAINFLERIGIKYDEKKFGDAFDGGMDKIHIICPVLALIVLKAGPPIFQPLFFAMMLNDVGGQFLLWRKNIQLVKQDQKKNIFEHLKVGKFKYVFQVLFVSLLFLSMDKNNAVWSWWSFWINLIIGTSAVLSFFSISCKLNRSFEKYIADGITLENVICGIVAIYIGTTNIFFAAALIFIAGAFDAVDGYIARKTGGSDLPFGDYKDSFADSVSFGLAPAMLMLYVGVNFYVALAYFILTCVRLGYYLHVHSSDGIFRGLPCPASATLLASFLLWKICIPIWVLETVIIFVSILEVSFIFEFVFKKIQMRWYHASLFREVAARKFAVLAGCIILFFVLAEGIGTGLTAMVLYYIVFLYKPLADKLR